MASRLDAHVADLVSAVSDQVEERVVDRLVVDFDRGTQRAA